MFKKLTISSLFFILATSFAFATNPVDPEKKEKDQVNTNKEIVSETNDAFKDLVINEEASAQPLNNEQVKTETKTTKPTQDDDVQSFNFLYYIIHQFKFSDFVTE